MISELVSSRYQELRQCIWEFADVEWQQRLWSGQVEGAIGWYSEALNRLFTDADAVGFLDDDAATLGFGPIQSPALRQFLDAIEALSKTVDPLSDVISLNSDRR